MTSIQNPPTEDPRLIRELQELWIQLNALEAAVTSFKICFFRPIGKQSNASHALNSAYVVLVMGSNRSGKTAWGAAEVSAHVRGYRPWLPEDHPDRIVRLPNGDPIPVPNVGRIIAQDFQQAIVQTIWPALQEWLPAGTYTVRKDNRGIPIQLTFDNGSIVYLMSNDQDDMVFEGTKGHWAWADEPIDYKKYAGLRRGLVDYNGHMFMTMTPLSQPWIVDTIYSRANEADGAVQSFHFDIWDNCIDNGGYLPRAAIEEFLKDLRDDEREAREFGKPIHLAGRVYKEWEPEAPFWIPERRLPDSWPRVCVIDPHPRKPVAVLWVAIDPDNRLWVYRDLFDPRLRTIKQVADRIKRLEGWVERVLPGGQTTYVRGESTERIALRIIDNSSKEQERTSGDTTYDRFATEGLPCKLANKRNASAGYDAIHEALTLRFEWSTPGLIVFNNCVHVKSNFLRFCFDEWATGKQRDLKGEKQDVRKTDDDFIDCIRYIYQMRLTYSLLRTQARYIAEMLEDTEEEYNGVMMDVPGMRAPMSRRERQQWRTSSGFQNSPGSNSRATALSSLIRPTPLPPRRTRNTRPTG